MRKKIILISFYLLLCFCLYQKLEPSTENQSISSFLFDAKEKKDLKGTKDDPIATLTISKIELERPIYALEDPKNNVEENVTLLKESILPPEENSIVFLAAHSGTGEKALFSRLDELEIGDTVSLSFDSYQYTYQVETREEQPKNGHIQVLKNQEEELVLTTCSEQDETKQLVIISKLIKKEK